MVTRTRSGKYIAAFRSALLLIIAAASLLGPPTASSSGATTTFDIRGRGWGHGVGMSQYGAAGFARHGFSYRDILSYYYSGTRLGHASDTTVRVLLRDGATELAVGSAATIVVRDHAGAAFTIPGGRYVLDSSLVLAAVGRHVPLEPPVRFETVSTPLRLDDHGYRGAIVVGRDGDELYAVNDVPVELYVRGVVPSEMPASWPREALRAQAVAARTYALRSIRRDTFFDLYPDTRSQAYGGIAAEEPTTTRAVDSTSGEVVTWDGRLAVTFYHSSSGGCTAASPDGIPGTERLPYLVAAPDPLDASAPEHRWGPLAISGATLGARLGLPAVTAVHVERNGSGRVAELSVTHDGGTSAVSGRAFARALGLPSTWFNVAPRGSAADTAPKVQCADGGKQAPAGPRGLAHMAAMRTHPAPELQTVIQVRNAGNAGQAPHAGRAPALAGGLIATLLAAFTGHVEQALGVRATTQLGTTLLSLTRVGLAPFFVEMAFDLAKRLRSATSAAGPSSTEAPARTGSIPPPLASLPADQLPEASSAPPASAGKPAPGSDAGPGPAAPAPAPSNSPAPSAPPPPAPPAASVAPPPPTPLQIQDVALISLDSAGAQISWRTTFPATTLAARGLHGTTTLWNEPGPLGFAHETVFAGLDPRATYTVLLEATDAWGRKTTATLELNTPAGRRLPTAISRSGAALSAAGTPFFPVLEWSACPERFDELLAAGVNMFMGIGSGCGAEGLARLDGRASSVIEPGTRAVDGTIGTYLPDELDGRLSADAAPAQVAALPSPDPSRGLTFLTLTNHFFSHAAPLPVGRDIYPGLIAKADVVGFDLYPLQEWCRPTALGEVFDAQSELVQLASGKPTYQWIEARAMKCHDPADAVTPMTVRAETWLAVAGGAHGIGFFPNDWRQDVAAEISRTSQQIDELTPALLADGADATSDTPAVRVGARALNGALYIVAVNSDWTPTTATIHIPTLQDRSLAAYGENRRVTPAAADTFVDTFQPLEVHVYVVAPDGWSSTTG